MEGTMGGKGRRGGSGNARGWRKEGGVRCLFLPLCYSSLYGSRTWRINNRYVEISLPFSLRT